MRTVLSRYPNLERIVIFSRDEYKQFEMSQIFDTKTYPNIRYFIGDVRDYSRLKRALEGVAMRSFCTAPVPGFRPAGLPETPIAHRLDLPCFCPAVTGVSLAIATPLLLRSTLVSGYRSPSSIFGISDHQGKVPKHRPVTPHCKCRQHKQVTRRTGGQVSADQSTSPLDGLADT